MLQPSPACAALIKGFEKCRLTAYLPTPRDRWTIGWGSTGQDVIRGMVITQADADARFVRQLSDFAGGVRQDVAGAPTHQDQFDAMVSFAYNIGLANFGASSLLRYHDAGLFTQAAAEFPKWIHQDGLVLGGLVRRRKAEMELYVMGSAVAAAGP